MAERLNPVERIKKLLRSVLASLKSLLRREDTDLERELRKAEEQAKKNKPPTPQTA